MRPDDLPRRVRDTMTELVRIPAPPGEEQLIGAYVSERLAALDIDASWDAAGNLIAAVPESRREESCGPLLLGAHLDRVAPASGCEPLVQADQMLSDGVATLGADDAAGITIILLTLEELHRRQIPHGPLTLLFSSRNELGLKGVREFDPAPWGAREGIVFENAGMPGTIVTRGPEIITIDATFRGIAGHTGQELAGTASAVEMFRRLELPTGVLDGGLTRISLERVTGGTARNAIAAELVVEGEVRTMLGADAQDQWRRRIVAAFDAAATAVGGTAHVEFVHSPAYRVGLDEPLVVAYREAWESAGGRAQTLSTFVGGDANVLRAMKGLDVFTVSIGVIGEHTPAETIALDPLERLTLTTVKLLGAYRPAPTGTPA
ncbi:MAG TPA: hypothetical protein VI318_10885 [Baekduia sp.]